MLEKIVASLKNSFHGSQGYGINNEQGDIILDFATTYDLILAKTQFKKRESYSFLHKQTNINQIYLILTQKLDSRCCNDCKVIPIESVTTQHRVVVLDICIRR